ncbi:hypothetical protein [Halorussus lipolyticus]|uniref:hypothetical protein n=1 Tax=Halorussus lipolyticus TaxID=3034024 RepID=UPI0023E88767|nr:hypothetical protein [Halorussus sp. DT80]
MSETATIVVERDDRMIHQDMEAIQGSIINPLGKLPEGTFERVQEEVQLMYEKSDLRNGERREVGEVKYEPGKDGDIIEIQVS